MTRLFRRHALRDVLFLLHLQMETQFITHLLFEAASSKDTEQTRGHDVKPLSSIRKPQTPHGRARYGGHSVSPKCDHRIDFHGPAGLT